MKNKCVHCGWENCCKIGNAKHLVEKHWPEAKGNRTGAKTPHHKPIQPHKATNTEPEAHGRQNTPGKLQANTRKQIVHQKQQMERKTASLTPNKNTPEYTIDPKVACPRDKGMNL